MDETTRYPRYPKDKNNQNLSMHGGNQKKLDNDRDSSQDENDEYKNSDLLPSGRANKKKERELYEEQIDETTRYSKNKNNQNLSMHNDNRNELNYNDNVGDSQKYSRSNKRNESESFYGGSRKEITNNQNNQSSYRDNNKDYYNSNNQEKNRKPD
ncbi:hypothetical protein GLOIN_2v1577181, partial [Rhizophagus irregularis DAOM 181602=DAOM 197198]